jgi:hypothetical protein
MTAVEPFSGELSDACFPTFLQDTRDRFEAAAPGSIEPYVEAARAHDFSIAKEGMRELARKRPDASDAAAWKKKQSSSLLAETWKLKAAAIAASAAKRERRLDSYGDPAEALARLVKENPKALPSHRVTAGLAAKLASRFVAKPEGGSLDDDELLSDMFDYQHAAVAAAYCDVFTADRKVAHAVETARTSLGLAAPLTPGRHPLGARGFVDELMASWC